MKQNVILNAFNRGIVSEKSLGRVDLERMRLSSVQQTNWIPRSLGSMTLRPGLEYIGTTSGNAVAVPIPFIYSATDTAYIEVTDESIRPIVSDAAITRASVSTTVTNGDFSSGTGWTIATTGGSSGAISGGKLTMECVAVESYVTCTRSESVAGGDQNVEHAVRVIVDRGPVYLRIGSTSGDDDYMTAALLGTGEHSLAFTPTGGTIYVQFEAREPRNIIVDSITIEASGEVTIDAPWAEADFDLIRWTQSGDVIFVSCDGYQPRKIERRSTTSWSLVNYEPKDGPFRSVSTDDFVKLSISAARGNATLTSTKALFRSTHVGALFRFFTPGYNFSFDLGQADVYTPAIRINGVGAARYPSFSITGTWAGTLTLQSSFVDEYSGFVDITSYVANTSGAYAETSDNVAVWVRIGFKAGAYVSGTATVTLSYGAGGGTAKGATSPGGRTGICRVTAVASATSASVEVLSDFSSSAKSADWYEGAFSDRRGWPSSVAFHEGRLFFGAKDQVIGSVSDAFESFDPATDGDSGPIQRSIGYGPIQIINWLMPLQRLMVGGEASEISVKSTSFDEPLTPTNFTMKDASTYGSARVGSIKVDTAGLFVDRAKIKLMEIAYDVNVQDYATSDLNQITPDLNIGNPIKKILVQRQPNTRIHCIRDDGTVAVMLYERRDQVACWYEIETDGVVEDGFVLPGDYEDSVYYIVNRTINGSTKRYYEKFAREDECEGATLNKQADCFYEYSGSAVTTISGLSHLEGETVYIWANGKSLGTKTVSSSAITGLSESVTSAIIGLTYRARYKSTKLAYAAGLGTAINQRKKVNKLGLLLYKTHHNGLQFGRDFSNMQYISQRLKGAAVATDTIHDTYDADMSEFPGDWDTDSRVCLEANAPFPATVLAMTMQITTNDT